MYKTFHEQNKYRRLVSEQTRRDGCFLLKSAGMPLWLKILLVALGGALGTAARYAVEMITRQPYGVWFINMGACFIMGIFFGVYIFAPWVSTRKESFQLFFMSGLVGGFSTFANYLLYCVNYFREGEEVYGIAYMVSTIVVGMLLMILGMSIGFRIYGS